MSMGEMKPKGYKAMERKMEMAEKKMKEEKLRKMIRQEINAAMRAKKTAKKK